MEIFSGLVDIGRDGPYGVGGEQFTCILDIGRWMSRSRGAELRLSNRLFT